MEKKIIIIAGEPSGDLQAGLLVSKLKYLDSAVKIYAVGGSFLKESGAEIIRDIEGLSVLGLFDALRKVRKFKVLMELVLDKVSEIKPDALIFVDFSGFNLRLAKKAGRLEKTRTIYYISPQVWASRPGRIRTIKEFVDKVIVIFKFEKDFYQRFGIDAEFVGHPLLEIVKPSMDKEQAIRELGLKEHSPIFTLLPGSRVSEIKYILPIMLESARLILEKIPQAQFVVAKPENLNIKIYLDIIKDNPFGIKISESRTYDCLNIADFVLVASGTATLETAIMERPNVVIYKMGLLNYLLYRPLVKLPFIGMENIVSGKLIAPEFIQFKARPKAIAGEVLDILQNNDRLNEMRHEFIQLKEKLGPPGAPLRAAEKILNFLDSPKR